MQDLLHSGGTTAYDPLNEVQVNDIQKQVKDFVEGTVPELKVCFVACIADNALAVVNDVATGIVEFMLMACTFKHLALIDNVFLLSAEYIGYDRSSNQGGI